LKSLAYCTDAVLEAAEEQQEARAGKNVASSKAAPKEIFSREELKGYFARNEQRMAAAAEKYSGTNAELSSRLRETAKSLESNATLLESPGSLDLEDLERRLTVLDDKLQAIIAGHVDEEKMLRIRRELDGQLAAYRGKMKAETVGDGGETVCAEEVARGIWVARLSLFYLS